MALAALLVWALSVHARAAAPSGAKSPASAGARSSEPGEPGAPSLRSGLAGSEPDWKAITADAKAILAELIRVDTSNPPGRETTAANVIGAWLGKAGIPWQVIESTPGRGNLVARLKGDGSARPLLLLAHLDVVGVERSKWTVPPFDAVEKDGYLYGRGAIDDKGMAAAFAAILIHAQRSGLHMKRDLVFLAEADEESGGTYGVKWMLANRPAEIDAEFAVNEGGTTELRDGRVVRVSIQATEKRYHDVRLTTRGPGGHASIPIRENPAFTLSRALARLEGWQPAVRLNPVTRAFLEGVAPLGTESFRAAVKEVLSGDPAQVLAGVRRLGGDHPEVRALLQDTVVPTLLSAGIRVNVIPSEAWANLNCRLLPDTDLEAFLAELKEQVADPSVEVTVETRPEGNPPAIMPLDSPLYMSFEEVSKGLWPQAVVVPYMSTGATDSEYLRQAGIATYGFGLPLESSDQMRMHGNDERVAVERLGEGTRFLYEVVARMNR